MIGEFLSDPANLDAALTVAKTVANAALGTNITLPPGLADALLLAKAAIPAAAVRAGGAIGGIKQAVNGYKKHRKNRRTLKTAAQAEAEQAGLRDGTAKQTVDDGPAIYPLIKKVIDPRLSREKKLAAVNEAFSTPPDKQSEDEESKRKQQLNREQFKSRQKQEIGNGGGAVPKLAENGRQSSVRGKQGFGPEEQERQDSEQDQQATQRQQFQKQTKQLRGEASRRMKNELKKKLKAEVKKKAKKAIKKKIIQRVLIWLVAAISPEVGIAVIILLVLLYILIHVCDIPLISVALFVVGFITGEDVGGICELAGG